MLAVDERIVNGEFLQVGYVHVDELLQSDLPGNEALPLHSDRRLIVILLYYFVYEPGRRLEVAVGRLPQVKVPDSGGEGIGQGGLPRTPVYHEPIKFIVVLSADFVECVSDRIPLLFRDGGFQDEVQKGVRSARHVGGGVCSSTFHFDGDFVFWQIS